MLFEGAEKINDDQAYWFKIRGDQPNTLIDTATPLFGLALRLSPMSSCDEIEAIYYQTVEEIKTIEIELTENGIEHAILMAYRYVLCAFLDEAVMGTQWGTDTVWAEKSLLSQFHNETWGGEKVFTILRRLEDEPEKYPDLLAFIHYCLLLGFEGKFRVSNEGDYERNRIIQELNQRLLNLNKSASDPIEFLKGDHEVVKAKYKLNKQLPLWTIFAIFIVIWGASFVGYSTFLSVKSQTVLTELKRLL